jgi:hypothetical protein
VKVQPFGYIWLNDAVTNKPDTAPDALHPEHTMANREVAVPASLGS